MARTLNSSGVDRRNVQHLGTARFFTLASVAVQFDVSPRSVRRWIADGKLVAHRFGSSVRIAESDLRAFIAQHRAA